MLMPDLAEVGQEVFRIFVRAVGDGERLGADGARVGGHGEKVVVQRRFTFALQRQAARHAVARHVVLRASL